MIISDDILRRDLVQLIRQIDTQMDEVKKQAENLGIEPKQLRDANGNWAISPLLVAKAQAYAALIQLQKK